MSQNVPGSNDGLVRWVILLVAAGHGYIHLCLMAFPPLFPVLSRELGLTYTELGLLSTGVAFSLGLSQIIAGPLSDRFGRKWLLIGGLLVFATATAMCGLASDFWPLLFLQILGGAGGSVMHPVALALVTDVTPPTLRGKSMALHGAGSMLGNALAPILMVSITLWLNWRFAMLVVGLLGVMVVCLMARYIPINPSIIKPPGESQPEKSQVRPFSMTAFIMVLILWVSRAITSRAYQTFLPTFLIVRYGISLEQSAVLIAAYWLIGAAAQMIGGYLADRFNDYLILWIASILTAISLSLMLFAHFESSSFIYLNFFLLGLFSFVGRPAFFSIYSEGLNKNRSGTFFSIGFTVSFSASSLIPWIMGWITDRFGTTVSFYPILVLVFVTVVILPMLWRMRSCIQVAPKNPDQPE